MIKHDTYHDIWTNYLMEKESSPMQVQAEGDGCCCCSHDRSDEEEGGWALQGHAQVNPALGTPCLGPVGLET